MKFRDVFYISTCVAFWLFMFLNRWPVPCPEGQLGIIAGNNGYWCAQGELWINTPNGKRALGNP